MVIIETLDSGPSRGIKHSMRFGVRGDKSAVERKGMLRTPFFSNAVKPQQFYKIIYNNPYFSQKLVLNILQINGSDDFDNICVQNRPKGTCLVENSVNM